MNKFMYLLMGLAMALPMSAQLTVQSQAQLLPAAQQQLVAADVQTVPQSPAIAPSRAARIGTTVEPYVATYKSLVRTLGDGGGQVRVGMVGDSLAIADLVLANAVVKAGVDGNQLSIPNWYSVGSIEGVGNIAFVALKIVDNTVLVDTTATAITGTLVDDETIVLDGMFGLFTTEAESASYYYVGQNCVIQKGNATMTMNYYGTDVSFAIIARQHDDVMTITNFGNMGLTFDAPLTTDREIAIGGGKFARIKPAASVLDFMVMGLKRYTVNDDGTITPIIYDSSLKAVATDDRTVTWDIWCGTNSSGAYVVGPFINGRIDFTEDVVYPVAPDLTDISGTGTETAPFLISNTDEWLAVAANVAAGNTHVGHYFALVADLDFSEIEFAPIGDATGFRGVFDGRGHTVTVNDSIGTSPRGLIGRLGLEGVVRNLNSAGQFKFGQATNVGGIVGIAASDALVENCTNTAAIITDGQGVGGVLGHGNTGTIVRNCKNEGSIHYLGNKNSAWLAGVVGYAQGVSMYDCGNEGEFIIDQPNAAGCIGGVFAYGIYNDEVVNCYNTADITAGQYTSGVMAYCDQKLLGWSVFKNCYNTGNITSTNTATNIPVGGVFANMVAGTQLIDCWNSGNVTTVGCNSAGGVVGRYIGPATDNIERAMVFKRCYNTGDITATASANMHLGGVVGFGNVMALDSCWNSGAVNNSQYVSGGVVGQIQNNSPLCSITNCYNTGDVTGGNWVGGIVGNANSGRPIDNCWNAGTVKAKNRAGGIAGYSAAGAKISRCFNVGEVSSTVETAGIGNNDAHTIGGVAGIYAGHITDSYNAGTVTAASRVGGIMGAPYRNANQDKPNYVHYLNGCYNVGQLNALPDSCGHIVGVHMQNNGTMWREYGFMLNGSLAQYVDTLQNCHYLNTINPDAIVETVADQAGHSAAELCQATISDSFTSPGEYCYPILNTQAENPYALLYAVTVQPGEADVDSEVITTNFHVGAPQGVTWSSSYAGLVFDGNEAIFSSEAYEGEVILTASIVPEMARRARAADEPLTRRFVIQVNKAATTAIDEVKANRQVKQVRYYNLQGMQVLNPDACGGIVIRVTDYTDGTRSTQRMLK